MRRLRVGARNPASGRPRATVRLNYVGPPFSGLDAGRMKGGGSLPDQVASRPLSGPGSYGPWEPKVAAVERCKASIRAQRMRRRKA